MPEEVRVELNSEEQQTAATKKLSRKRTRQSDDDTSDDELDATILETITKAAPRASRNSGNDDAMNLLTNLLGMGASNSRKVRSESPKFRSA